MKLRGITLTIKKNPFNCDGREIHQIEYEPGKSISDYCAPFAEPEVDFVYGLNGKVVDGDAVPIDGDFITICPVVGKNILSTILTVGLMVFTGGLFPAGSAFGAFGIKAGTFLAGVVQASVMMIGGALINMLCPPQTADTTIDIKQSDPLYTWGNIDSQTEQGGALAKTYGTMKTSGTILSRHVTTDGKNQYLNILLTGGEGPIESISDIRINDNPIGNYDGVVVETRLGTNDQTVIANFNDSFADEGLAYELELSGGYSTQLTGGNATQGLEVTLECSNGLYYMNDDSSLAAASVTYQLQYRLAGGAWQDWGTFTISGAESTAVRSVKRLDNLTPGQYEVRAQCTAKSGTSTRYSTRLFWTQVTTIIYDDFVRPGKTLVGIKALATSQLSGSSINVTWLQTRSTVNVWNGSTYVKKPATNPAWVAYDMLHGCRELKNIHTGLIENVVGNVAASRFIYSDFEAWADHCDSLGLSFNHIFTEAADLWDALKIPELFGRGKVIQRGTKFGCTCDKPGIPVQLFTVGNIANESYSKDILPITDRANAVEISFVNAAKNYTKDTFVVYSSDYDTDGVIKSPTQITLAGCTSYEKAYQHGKYLLRVNKLILRTITLKADIDAIGCQYGDQVLVQHDVPRWGDGGRIKEATTLTLKLDRKVVMVSGESYGVIVRLSDDTLVTKTVITLPGETDIITVSNAFESVPQEQDLYSFGLINKIAKPFIVIDVDRDDDKRATISAIEYVEAVYEESLDAPVINYGDYAVKPLAISVAETYPRPAGGNANVSVSWIWPRDSRVSQAFISVGRSSGSMQRVKTVTPGDLTGTTISVGASGTWVIGVVVADAFGSTIAQGSASVIIDATLPGNVSSITMEENTFLLKDGTALSDLLVTFTAPENPVGLVYHAYYDIDNSGTWNYYGQAVPAGFTIKALKNAASVKVKIVSVNANTLLASSGLTSASYTITGKSAPPSDVTGFTATVDPTDSTKIKLACNKITDLDFKAIEIRIGNTWGTATPLPLLYGFDTIYTASASGLLTFRARALDWSNNYSQNEAVVQVTAQIEPATPTGFNAVQNGREVLLFWGKNAEADVVGYEVRQGATFDSGALVASGITETSLSVPVSTETTYKYWVKAYNRAGNYSAVGAAVSIAVSDLPPVNVILTFDEIALQSGVHTRTAFGPSYYTCLTFPGLCSDYPITKCNEVGGTSVLKLSGVNTDGVYLAARKDLGGIVTVNLKANFISSALIGTGSSARLQIRTSKDGSSWDDWSDFVPATKTTRYIDWQVVMEQYSASYPVEVGIWTELVDVDDKDITGTYNVPAGGATINYGYAYHAQPVGVVTAIGAGLYADVTARGLNDFSVVVRNASTNADVGGEIDYRFKGY